MTNSPLLGAALMQPGTQDPTLLNRIRFGQALMLRGADTSPVQSPWEAVGRIGTAGLGGYFTGKAEREATTRDEDYSKALGAALAGPNVMEALNGSTNRDVQRFADAWRVNKALTPSEAPKTVDTYDASGRKVVKQFNPQTGRYDIDTGGSQVERSPIPFGATVSPDGQVGTAPGFLGHTAVVEGTKANAGVPAQIAVDRARIREVGPGATLVAPPPGGGAPSQIYQSPNPAPGTQQGKLEAGLGEQQAATITGWQTAASNATNTLSLTRQMREAVTEGLQTGTAAGMRQSVARALTTAGVAPETVNAYFNLPAGKQFDNASNQLVLSIVKGLGPNPSNADREFIERTIPLLRESPGEITRVLDLIEKRAQGHVSRFQDGYAAYKAGQDPLQFEIEWNRKNGGGSGSIGSGPAASGGAETKSLNGKNYIKRNGNWFEQ